MPEVRILSPRPGLTDGSTCSAEQRIRGLRRTVQQGCSKWGCLPARRAGPGRVRGGWVEHEPVDLLAEVAWGQVAVDLRRDAGVGVAHDALYCSGVGAGHHQQ